ncbi:AmmeMemoRadiSam system protein A [bacterium]|nr:AmmeMemoRadiSam system protein A [bacterium]
MTVNNTLHRILTVKKTRYERRDTRYELSERSEDYIMAHPLVQLAIDAIKLFVEEGNVLASPDLLTDEMKDRAGVFVSLKKHGELRGCIGTLEPTQPTAALEIIHNAISAASRDPRFPSVESHELLELSYSVDILTKPEPVEDVKELDVKRYGVIVESGVRKGLLLPDLEGVDTVDYQLSIAKQKAGLSESEPVKIYRFEVKRYK